MDLLQVFQVERLDTCGMEGFELDCDERDAHRNRGREQGPALESDMASPSITKGDFSAIRQHRQMADRRKSQVMFISPLEEEEDLKSVKLTPKNKLKLTKARSALTPFVFEENEEFYGLSPSESGSEKTPTSLTRRNSETKVSKTGGWFKRTWSAGVNPP